MLPPTAKVLYTYMTLLADDDGIVDLYSVESILRIADSKIDVNLLIAAGLIFPLEEIDIYYIEKWQDTNDLRTIYKVNSQYIETLHKMRPDVITVMSKKEWAKMKNLP